LYTLNYPLPPGENPIADNKYYYYYLITKFSVKYRDKTATHPNGLASTLLEEEKPRRLKRFKPTDLTARFS
jgi:hypothetical protein